MSVAAELHNRYRDVRRRLMGKPVREVSEKMVPLDGPEETIRYVSRYQEMLNKQAAEKVELERRRQALVDAVTIAKASGQKQPAALIMRSVAYRHGISFQDLIGPSRKHVHVKARHEAIHEVKICYPCRSLPEIGRLFGGRDHTTILHALRKPYKSTYVAQEPNWDRLANPAQ